MSHLIKSMLAVLLLIGLVACISNPTMPTATPVPSATPTPLPVAIPTFDELRTLMVGDIQRTYFLHIPDGLNDQQSVPLVFVFHGFLDSGQIVRFATGLDKIANANGFIVVYPDGSGGEGNLSWNAGVCCVSAVLNDVDEPAFVRSILADVETIVSVDSKRIYAAGFSNGAMLSYRLACEMSDMFAAIAPVSGVLTYTPCQPKQKVSVLHVHGALDTFVRLEGEGGINNEFPSVKESLATWVKLNNCSGEEKVEHNGILTHSTYSACTPGVSVELYLIDGYGHGWLNTPNAPISQIVWDFFASHPKP